MKIYFYILLAVTSGVMACKKAPKKRDDIPKALQDKSIDVSELTKRTNADLLDNLFNELKDTSETLKGLEREIELLQRMKADTGLLFKRYDDKNLAFYAAAARHFNTIKDSALRSQIKQLVDSSRADYTAKIAEHKSLLAGIDSSNISLNDLYTLVKILKTLPLIETYQNSNLPDSSSLKMILSKYAAAGAKTAGIATPALTDTTDKQ